jgi:hypothetical protein
MGLRQWFNKLRATGQEVRTAAREGWESARPPETPAPHVLINDSAYLSLPQLRTTVFRNCEIDVHTADSIADAQRLCRLRQFDMVLLAADHHSEEVSLICDELRKVAPRQSRSSAMSCGR